MLGSIATSFFCLQAAQNEERGRVECQASAMIAAGYLWRRLKPTLFSARVAQQDYVRHDVALQDAELLTIEREVVGVD